MKKHMPFLISFVLALSWMFSANAIIPPSKTYVNTIRTNDINMLLGEWEGAITYMDYKSNTPFTMPANLNVVQGKNKLSLILFNVYPNEPQANDKDKIKISKDYRKINNRLITSRKVLSSGQVEIIVEYSGKDDNKRATIRNIYLISPEEYIIQKKVQFVDGKDWILRNEYKYIKKK